MSTWLSDPRGMWVACKDEAVRRLTVQLRSAGASADQQAQAADALCAELANVLAEEYPTPQEYTEAVEELAARFAAEEPHKLFPVPARPSAIEEIHRQPERSKMRLLIIGPAQLPCRPAPRAKGLRHFGLPIPQIVPQSPRDGHILYRPPIEQAHPLGGLSPAPGARAAALTPGDPDDSQLGFHRLPVERRQCAPGVEHADQVPQGPSGIHQIDEHDGVRGGDQLVRADSQQAEIGAQTLERAGHAAMNGLLIEGAHGERDQSQAVCPGGVEQEAAQQIKEALG